MDEKEALSELRHLERRLADIMAIVTRRITDEDARDGVQRIAEAHARQADELDRELAGIGAAQTEAPRLFRDHIAAMEREVLHARDEDGLFIGLADAEMLDLRLHEHMLSEALRGSVRDVVERQTGDEHGHVDFLETRAPGMTPTIHGVRTVPKRGPVV